MTTAAQPLTEQQIARLERLRNRTTLHELAAINTDRKILVCYASRSSRSGIRAALEGREERVDAVVKLTGDNGATWAPRAADGCRMGDWTNLLAVLDAAADALAATWDQRAASEGCGFEPTVQ
jgi:hypothetical protein